LGALAAMLSIDPRPAEVIALRATLADRRFAWPTVLALADSHLMLAQLWPALLDKGLAVPVPDPLRGFLDRRRTPGDGRSRSVWLVLEESHAANAARNERIRRQTIEAIGALNGAGVEPAVLKGARLLLAGDSPYLRGRCLRDIDLVVPRAAWAAGALALRAIGYAGDVAPPGEARQESSFTRPGEGASIDLHIAPLTLHEPAALPSYLTGDGLWARARRIERDGAVYHALPPGESLIHSILHTEVADLNYVAGDWALRYLYETAVLAGDPASGIDWSLAQSLDGTVFGPPLRAHLHAAQRLFGGVPAAALQPSWRRRRHFLRCRLNASHPGSIRRVNFLLHKFRQAMSTWYLQREGFYRYDRPGSAAVELWRARLRALGAVARLYGARLPRLLLGADSGLPPPRV
jgi:hypothetical protein